MKSRPRGASLGPTMRVRPRTPELRVAVPERGGIFLPPEGMDVNPSSYWTRRIADGDVLVVDEKTAAAPARARREQPHAEA